MTVYPFAIDSDSDIIRIDDNITELAGEAINQLRDAMFAVQKELGIRPSGSSGTVASRLDTSLNADGSIKTSALISVGLATLPISNSQVGTNAGISEFKLDLDYSTSDLYTLTIANQALLNSINAFAQTTESDLTTHLGGGVIFADGSPGRHVASHIDINSVPTDSRDALFTWAGLLDKDGNLRSATHVAAALQQINDALTTHENAVASAHVATAIDIDVANFETVPMTVNTLQKFADYIDDFDAVTIREHRQIGHINGIPSIARSTGTVLPDGYGWQNVVPATACSTFLVRSPSTSPTDNISTGDDLVSFIPDNTGNVFDSYFARVSVGDIIRINYANGMEASYPVDSIRFIPGTEWIIRLNGVNLADVDGGAFARIDRPLADRNTEGVLAVAAANATPTGSFNSILQSAIVGNPRAAVTVGNGFDAGQLDASHYKLYIEMYPTGNPADYVMSLPFIDVTGNAGTTPGQYTLDSVVQATNDKLREIGYNLRFIAFAHEGNFGIMLADAINNVSFAIINGTNALGTLIESTFTENVVGDTTDNLDALGLGANHSAIASPSYVGTFFDATAALTPTKVVVPRKSRNYIVDGVKSDEFAPTWLANDDGYWDGYISSRVPVGLFTIETTYAVELHLKPAGLKPGKTIVIQPTLAFTDGLYNDVDYGRFIIKSVNFADPCPGQPALTLITVINGIHATANGFANSAGPPLAVRLYFGEDSVSFNNQNIIDTAAALDFLRLHEIFIDNNRTTFSHERGRMPLRTEGAEDLSTINWHIEGVSSKLRGYKDTPTEFNKFIRFYILSYDTDNGEYTGYIGQRDPATSAISKVGPITTGRKNVPTRFYDETNVDYIDLIFIDETTTAPGSAVLSDGISGGGGTARFVDIELFESLQLNDELLILATAEVNWSPSLGQNVVQRVRDKRDFGSVDEIDFSTSALEFITAGDRHLHENGVLRGLDFDFINPTDNREIFYKGGASLVNGTIVTVNAISVTIPEIHLATDAPPATVDWAVCVNESGHLEPIIVTATKVQFFAKDNNSVNEYYVPSVTFQELIDTRKDLTPIAVVTSTIASTTITDADHLDIRRFIDDGKGRDLVFSPVDFTGTFHTTAALVNWANQYNSSGPLKVKVRGTFNVETALDFTGLTNKIELDGDGAEFNVTAGQGILVSNNIAIKNCSFNYNPTGLTLVTGVFINSANGCIYGTGSMSDVSITNCIFNSAATAERPPFVSFEIDNANVLENIEVSNNKCNDTGGGVSDYQAAISIIHLNAVVSTEPAVIYNVKVEGNICNKYQGIFITQEALNQASSAASIDAPGIRAFDTSMSYNNAGLIGWLTTSTDTTATLPTTVDRASGIIVKSNTAVALGNVFNQSGAIVTTPGTGFVTVISMVSTFALGNASVLNNNCSFIGCFVNEDVSEDAYGKVLIDGNTVSANDPVIIENWAFAGTQTVAGTQARGIAVYNGLGDPGRAIISNNSLDKGFFDSTERRFVAPIELATSGIVTGNNISGIADNGVTTTSYGIFAFPTGAQKEITITNNHIYRDSALDITQFIFLGTTAASVAGKCTGNTFNSAFIDSGDTDDETINGTGTGTPATPYADTWIVEGNKNQTDSLTLRPGSGSMALGLFGQATYITAGNLTGFVLSSRIEIGIGNNTPAITCFRSSGDNGDDIEFVWLVPLHASIPHGARIVDIAATYTPDATPATTSTGTVVLRNISGSTTAQTTGITLAGATVTLSPLPTVYTSNPAEDARAEIIYRIVDAAATNYDTTIDVIINYRW